MSEQQAVTLAGQKKPCCADDANLRVIESKATLTVRRCVVCGCRHFEAIADAGTLFAKPVR